MQAVVFALLEWKLVICLSINHAPCEIQSPEHCAHPLQRGILRTLSFSWTALSHLAGGTSRQLRQTCVIVGFACTPWLVP